MKWISKPPLGTPLNWAHPLNKGLVGFWLFNEGMGDKAYDISGNSNHGTLTNMAFPPSAASGWNPGRKGKSLQFDSVNDYVDVGNGASLNITNAITIEAWVKPTSFLSYMSWVYRKNTATSTPQWRVTFGTSSNQWGITWNDGGWRDYWATDTIPLGVWSHTVVVVNKAASTIILYRNGINVGSFTSVNVNFQDSTGVAYIGRQLENNAFFNGTIDEARIWNRALSASEVQELYINPYGMFL